MSEEIESAKKRISLSIKKLKESASDYLESYHMMLKDISRLETENTKLKQQLSALKDQKPDDLTSKITTPESIGTLGEAQNLNKETTNPTPQLTDNISNQDVAQDDLQEDRNEDVDLSINQLKSLLAQKNDNTTN